MNDIGGLLNSDYGFKPQGKAAPMSARSSSVKTTSSSYTNLEDPLFNPKRGVKGGSVDKFDDVFGGPPKNSSTSDSRRNKGGDEFDFINMLGGGKEAKDVKFDKPVFDEEEVKGSGLGGFDNVFVSLGTVEKGSGTSALDELLGGGVGSGVRKDDGVSVKKDGGDFDDLIQGFGGSSPVTTRHNADIASKKYSHVKEDPFSGTNSHLTQEGQDSGTFTDPLEEIGKVSKNGNMRVDESQIGVFEDMHPFDRHVKEKPSRTGSSSSGRHVFCSEKSPDLFFADSPVRSRKKAAQNNLSGSSQSMFGMPSSANNSHIYGDRSVSPPSYENSNASGINSPSSAILCNTKASDDIWLTVSEVPLFTQPTSAPPPSRAPPPRPARVRKTEARDPSPRTSVHDFPPSYNSTQTSQSFKSGPADARSSVDELDDLSKSNVYARSRAHTDVFNENLQAQSDAAASAAVMKEVMNRAEAKFRHAKELKERENARAFRNRQNNTHKDDEEILDSEINRKELEKQRFEQERMRDRELEREREVKEREKKRLERERAQAIEEREKARQAVERATREARGRAAAAARLRAEKASLEKANSEVRERAERLAVQRAQAEARVRAAAEAKERAEKIAAEAKERTAKAENEARIRAERAAVDRVARERAAAQAREKASTTRVNPQNPEDDLESFFGTGSRPTSAPRAGSNNSDSFFNTQPKQGTEDARRSSSSFSNIRKTSSSTSIVDDLSSIFGGSPPQSGSFREMEGETEERRRARLERDQRTNERAAKALAEKNERDLQAQREQAERHKFSESLDFEIKRWAAGKEGNIRALLSTMQYILWPECGWQPVSLTDLITGASVKKTYRKATLCIHPDKVQQKGANLQQKYIAEKVFDLLKEAWNKFNSEELF